MLRICSAPGCGTFTLGALCAAHEPVAVDRVFPRGRPYRLKDRELLAPIPAHLVRAGKEPAASVVLLEGAG
jgi:hypothetical protein